MSDTTTILVTIFAIVVAVSIVALVRQLMKCALLPARPRVKSDEDAVPKSAVE